MLISQGNCACLAQNTQFGFDYTTCANANCSFACTKEGRALVGLNLESFTYEGLCWSVIYSRARADL